jgi:hypothetical protein
MGHRVAFQPARLLNVPGLGANRCQRFECPIGTGRAGATPRVRRTKGRQHSINLSGDDAQKLLQKILGQRTETLLISL